MNLETYQDIKKHEHVILPLVNLFKGELIYFRTEPIGFDWDKGYLIKFLYHKELEDYQIGMVKDFFNFRDVMYRPKGYQPRGKHVPSNNPTNKGPYTFIKKIENVVGSDTLEILITVREDLLDLTSRINTKIIDYNVENEIIQLKIIP